jgi:hypothetical protein
LYCFNVPKGNSSSFESVNSNDFNHLLFGSEEFGGLGITDYRYNAILIEELALAGFYT